MNIFEILGKFGPLYDRQTKEETNVKQLKCKFFGLLFTAQWCQGCHQLNKTLPGLLKKVDKTGQDFKLITIRVDNSSSRFAQNYYHFPGLLHEEAQKLCNLFKVKSFPKMIVYNIRGKMVSLNGVEDMQKFREHTLKFWGQI